MNPATKKAFGHKTVEVWGWLRDHHLVSPKGLIDYLVCLLIWWAEGIPLSKVVAREREQREGAAKLLAHYKATGSWDIDE